MKVSNKTFFSFVAFAIVAILVVAGGAWVAKQLADRFFAQDVDIESITRRSTRALVVAHPDLADRAVFGNVITLSDIDEQIASFCGDGCERITLTIDEAQPIPVYPLMDRTQQYLVICGYTAPRFTETVNQGARQRCLDDYSGSHAITLAFSNGRDQKLIETRFEDFVLGGE